MSAHDASQDSAAKALEESGERYRVLFDAIDEGFCIIEVLFDERGEPADYRFIDMNRTFVAQTGLAGARGHTIREFVPQHERHWFEVYGRVALTGEPARFENEDRHLVPPRFYEVHAFRYGAAEKRQVAVLFKDIGPRRRAEQALRDTEGRYRELVRHAPAGIYEVDFRRRRFVSLNDAMCDMLGYSRDELMAMDPSSIVEEDGRTRFQQRVRSWLGGEQPARNVEYKVQTKDGRTLDVVLNVTFTKAADGQPLGATVVAEDVTARKRVEDALAKANRLLGEAQRIARLGSWQWEISSDTLSWSKETFLLLGYEPGSVVPSYDRFLALVHPEDRPKVARAIEEALSGRTHYDLDFRILRPDASVSWIHSAGEVSFDEGGHPTAMTGVVLDITDRMRAEEALRDADRRKDEFIAILSHELRNPLAPIRYALPLLSAEPLGEAGRRAVAVIDRQAAHLARLVDDLLDVSRITAGKIELRRDHVTLATLVAAAVEAASPAIASGRHSLDISVPDEPVWLNADPTRISQAITNLLNNSAKYTPQGGRIRLQAASDGTHAVLRVSDNGIGIAPDALQTVFEIFRQVNGPNRTQGGLGVGLTLTRQFVEMHGGTIEAHSAGENAGAEFVIRLPLATAALIRDDQPEPGSTGHPARLRVLVVDDNLDLVDMLAMVVEAAGHDVRKAFDGASAVSAALEYQPHLILLDVGMPGMNGFEVATEVRRHPQMANTRIVALTGWGHAEDRRRTAQAGFDDHLTKPTDPQQIQQILREVVHRVTASRSA